MYAYSESYCLPSRPISIDHSTWVPEIQPKRRNSQILLELSLHINSTRIDE